MELQAAIEALSALKEPCEVEFFTDSKYLRNGVQDWVEKWKSNGWQTAAKRPVKNEDLWRELDQLNSRHEEEWNWVQGHAGAADNERCDDLDKLEIEKVMKHYTRQQLKEELKQFRAAERGNSGQLSFI